MGLLAREAFLEEITELGLKVTTVTSLLVSGCQAVRRTRGSEGRIAPPGRYRLTGEIGQCGWSWVRVGCLHWGRRPAGGWTARRRWRSPRESTASRWKSGSDLWAGVRAEARARKVGVGGESLAEEGLVMGRGWGLGAVGGEMPGEQFGMVRQGQGPTGSGREKGGIAAWGMGAEAGICKGQGFISSLTVG